MGTRLREETTAIPKPMVSIGGRPILWHIMKIYAHAGFNEFVLCLGYKSEVIKDYFLNFDSRHHDFTVRLGPLSGMTIHSTGAREEWTVTLADTGLSSQTGDRIGIAKRYLDGDRFLVTYGDGVADIDVRDVLATHKKSGKLATVTAVRPSSRFGELSIAEGMVSSFQEKPQVGEGWINGGFMVFEREVLERFSPGIGSLENGVLVELAKEGQLAVHQHGGFWQCMDTYREMKLLEDLWESQEAAWKIWR